MDERRARRMTLIRRLCDIYLNTMAAAVGLVLG
jgi:hypothetical protein